MRRRGGLRGAGGGGAAAAAACARSSSSFACTSCRLAAMIKASSAAGMGGAGAEAMQNEGKRLIGRFNGGIVEGIVL